MNLFLHEAFPNPNKISFPAMYNMPRLYRGKQLKNQSKIQKIGVSGHFFFLAIFKQWQEKNSFITLGIHSGLRIWGRMRGIGHADVSLHWFIQAGRLICGMKPFRSIFHLIPFFTPQRSVRGPIWACFSCSFHAGWRTRGKVYFLFLQSFLLVLAKISFWRGVGTALLFYGVLGLSWHFLISQDSQS